jgi:transposase
MSNIEFKDSVIVGIDIHKRRHTAVIETPFCQTLEYLEFENSSVGFKQLKRKVQKYSKGNLVVYGLEDSNGNGYNLAKYLSAFGGNSVLYHVPSNYTRKERHDDTHCDKSDLLDAKRVAKVILTKSDKLPKIIITKSTKRSKDLKNMMSDHGELAELRRKTKQVLHKVFADIFGVDYAKEVKYKDIFCKKARVEWLNILKQKESYDAIRAVNKLKTLTTCAKDVQTLERMLDEETQDNIDIQILRSIPGCGLLLASKLMGEIKDIKRFASASKLAKYSGVAPVGNTSAGKGRHYTDFRGNRKLNHALYQLALCQVGVRGSKKSKKYYARKQKEGKSKLHSLRCLRRRFVDIIFSMLTNQKMYDVNFR